MTELDDAKERYITYELGLLSLQAAKGTRAGKGLIYAKGVKPHQREPAKREVRSVLEDIKKRYLAGDISEENHITYIEQTASHLSNSIGKYLDNGRFRIGISQKLVNLHLKYLWAARLIPEPPHCPIDSIICKEAKIDYTWTTSDCVKQYREAIADLKIVAEPASLSVWELRTFRRRGDA